MRRARNTPTAMQPMPSQRCAAIDQFGLFGAPQTPITPQRWLGIGCMAVGVFLARRMA